MNPGRLAWLGLFLFLGACRALPPAPPPTAILAYDEVWSRLQSRQQQVQSFQARGRVIFLSPERNFSGTALFKGKAPATLRVDTLDFLGRSVLSFASDGVQMQVLSPKEGKLFCGRATPKNLAYALLPPVVTLPQVLSLLKGGLPLSPGPPDRGDYDPAQGLYLLEWRRADGALTERLWVKADGLNTVKEEWYGHAGQVRFTVELADFGRLPADLPGQITLRTNSPKSELRLFYSEMVPNPTLVEADLVLTPPAQVEVIRLRP